MKHLLQLNHYLWLAVLLLLTWPAAAQTSVSPSYEILPVEVGSRLYNDVRDLGQLGAVPDDDLLLMYEVPVGNGVCILEANTLRDLGLEPGVDIPSDVTLWRLQPTARLQPENAWIEYPYLYNPQTQSIRYQCVGSATFALLRGTPQFSFNAGLSDAGSTTESSGVALLLVAALLSLGAYGITRINSRAA